MANGNEVVLGFRFHEYGSLNELSSLDLTTLNERSEDEIRDALWTDFNLFNDALKMAHIEMLKEAGFTILGERNGHIVAQTPMGVREFSPIHLYFYFDPYELGEEIEDSIIGIAISGRYVPTFLDWRSEHGTMWNITFDNELLDMAEIARAQIVKVLPQFQRAHIIIRETHY